MAIRIKSLEKIAADKSLNDSIYRDLTLDIGLKRINNSNVFITVTSGGFISGDQILLASNTSVIGNISSTTTLTGTPVTNLVYEDVVNESKRRIKILKSAYVDAVVRDFKKKLSE